MGYTKGGDTRLLAPIEKLIFYLKKQGFYLNLWTKNPMGK